MSTIEEMKATLLDHLAGIYGVLRPTVYGMLEQAAQVAPDRAAILEPGRESLTYAQLLRQARRMVQTLNGLGFGPGSRIALALPSTAESAVVYFSVMAGMTIIPTASNSPSDEYERYLRHTSADAVLVRQGMTPGAIAAAQRLGIPAFELAFDPARPVGSFEVAGAPDFSALEPQFAQPRDIAGVLPTSGTTSLPKLAPRTQEETALIAYFGFSIFYLHDDERYPIFGIMPLYHASGFGPLMRSIAGISGFACIPSASAAQVFPYLATYRPGSTLMAPAMLQSVVDEAPAHEERMRQFQLKRITVVSSLLPEQLLREAQRIFRADIQILYGMTEMHFISTALISADAPAYTPGFVGHPVPFGEVIIAGDDGVALPPRHDGEILVRSPLVFSGYENNPHANAEAFRDGWFRTGDVGSFDTAGNLSLTGRVKEMINRGGSKIAPLDVDAVLLEHPAVLDAATFGFPHSTLGEDVAAAIVLRGQGATERELRSFAARRLASYKVPSRFVFVREIPRTALGKIKRTTLAEQFKAELRR